MAFLGNVIGEAGYHTTYNATGNGNCRTSIYALGWQDLQCAGTFDNRVGQTLMRWGNYDVVTGQARFCGSAPFPSYCGGVSEVPTEDAFFPNTVPVNQLPPSFYLGAQPPAWWATPWATPPYPAVGPDVSGGNVTSGSGEASTLGGHAHKIPARLCYENLPNDMAYPTDLSGLYIKLFDALTCYPNW